MTSKLNIRSDQINPTSDDIFNLMSVDVFFERCPRVKKVPIAFPQRISSPLFMILILNSV
jgi:hypothetical protein